MPVQNLSDNLSNRLDILENPYATLHKKDQITSVRPKSQ